jgi:hypothetical protein
MMRDITEPHWTSCEALIIPPSRRADITEVDLDGEALLRDTRDGHIHRFNGTALVVWHACDGRTSTRGIAEQLTERFDVDFADALSCVEQLVTRFAELHLLDGSNIHDSCQTH